MAATDLKCELSWSASRAKEFDRCKREYWYARYSSWGWWTERPRGSKYEAMVHKNLTSMPAFTGDVIHRAIERWFQLRRAGSVMSAADLFEEAREMFRSGWRQSSTDGWKERPNKCTHLFEHHYAWEIPMNRTDAARDLMQRSTQYFMQSPDLAPVRQAEPDGWLAVESLDTYQFQGTKVYAVPDFAYQVDDKVHIWDWKTGKPREDDIFQLHTYALYACERWHTDPEDITLYAAYLGEGRVQTIPVQIEILSAAQDRMSLSLREMMDVHYDPDVDDLIMENWPTSGAPDNCRYCRFRGICDAVANGEDK
jgi:CRISPR/Cas system-associated exonuclease Cas4 (RecB family)